MKNSFSALLKNKCCHLIKYLLPPVSEYGVNEDIIILGAGFNYERAAKIIARKVNRYKVLFRQDFNLINLSYPIESYLGKNQGFVYYRDYISSQEELVLFGEAYERTRLLSDSVLKKIPSVKTMISAMYHTFASELFKLTTLCYGADRQSKTRVIAIIDAPFINNYIIRAFKLYQVLRNLRNKKNYKNEQEILGWSSPFYQNAWTKKQGKMPILLLIDDSGSWINLTSAIAVIQQLIAGGAEPVVLTGNYLTRDALKSHCKYVYLMPSELSPEAYLLYKQQYASVENAFLRFFQENNDVVWKIYSLIIMPMLALMLKRSMSLEASIDALYNRYKFKVALSFNEGNYVPAGGISYLKSRGIETVGIASVLYKTDHPESSYWPAKYHLVYGDQVIKPMVRSGIELNNIRVVGSEHYDRCIRRNIDNDKSIINSQFPHALGKKLVVVATEARPRQMIEIEPSVKCLSEFPDVYIIIKLHPDDHRYEFEQMLKRLNCPDNVVIVDKTDLHALLNVGELLITMGSNLILEAAVMGTLTLVHNFSNAPCFIDFVNEGLCFGAYSVEEFRKKAYLLLYDPVVQSNARKKLTAISKFNGPNDGRSSQRIANFAIELAKNS